MKEYEGRITVNALFEDDEEITPYAVARRIVENIAKLEAPIVEVRVIPEDGIEPGWIAVDLEDERG